MGNCITIQLTDIWSRLHYNKKVPDTEVLGGGRLCPTIFPYGEKKEVSCTLPEKVYPYTI